ncbi:MAG: hypothetical protein ACYDBV_04745 [Nitrospiria bacterium]
MNGYALLPDVEKKVARNKLHLANKHFYHVTAENRLNDIKRMGLDPKEDANYELRTDKHKQFGKAICYGLKKELRKWVESVKDKNGENEKPILLRISSETFLKKSFGLDHTHGILEYGLCNKLTGRIPELLSADEFIQFVDDYKVIVCFDVIQAEELEICTSDIEEFCDLSKGTFAPLVRIQA